MQVEKIYKFCSTIDQNKNMLGMIIFVSTTTSKLFQICYGESSKASCFKLNKYFFVIAVVITNQLIFWLSSKSQGWIHDMVSAACFSAT